MLLPPLQPAAPAAVSSFPCDRLSLEALNESKLRPGEEVRDEFPPKLKSPEVRVWSAGAGEDEVWSACKVVSRSELFCLSVAERLTMTGGTGLEFSE